MDIEGKIHSNNLVRLRNEHLTWIGVKEGDEIILRDDVNKKGQRYIAIWRKNG